MRFATVAGRLARIGLKKSVSRNCKCCPETCLASRGATRATIEYLPSWESRCNIFEKWLAGEIEEVIKSATKQIAGATEWQVQDAGAQCPMSMSAKFRCLHQRRLNNKKTVKTVSEEEEKYIAHLTWLQIVQPTPMRVHLNFLLSFLGSLKSIQGWSPPRWYVHPCLQKICRRQFVLLKAWH